MFGVFFVLQVLAAVGSSPRHWLTAALLAGLLAFQALWPRRLRRRIERLQRGGDAPTGPRQRS